MRKTDYPYRDEYRKHLIIIRGLQEVTFKNYSRELELFYGYLEEEAGSEVRDPLQIESIHILKYLNSVADTRGDLLQIRYRILIALRSYFDFLDRYNYLKDKLNPVLRFKLKRPKRKLPIYLTLEEAKKFLEAAKTGNDGIRDYAIFHFLLLTGCRLGELLALRLDYSLDFENRRVRLFGKNSKERMVPLTENTCQILQEYLAVRKPVSKDEQALFLDSKGQAINAYAVRTRFKEVCEKAGLNKAGLTVHKLRHTCLTLLLNAGVDLYTLKQIAGHEKISTTAVYLHVSQEKLRDAVEKLPFS